MENRTELLEIAYKYLEKQKSASFNDIWKHVKKELSIPSEYEEKVIGNLYTGMILDPNFFLKSDKLWYPRNQVPLDEIKSQVSSIPDEQDDFDLVESQDESEIFNKEETDEDEDDIFIAEDSYDDGDIEDINVDLSKRVLKEEFQD